MCLYREKERERIMFIWVLVNIVNNYFWKFLEIKFFKGKDMCFVFDVG